MTLDKEQIKQALKEHLQSPEAIAERKEVFKEAFDEWVDKQFAKFGRTVGGIFVLALFAAALFLWAKSKGVL